MGCSPACVLLVLLLTIATDVSAQKLVASENPLAVDSNVTLMLSPETALTAGTWSHDGSNIILWYPGSFQPNPTWKDHVIFNDTSLTLFISSLQVNDSGLYILQSFNPPLKASLNLSVQVPIVNVTLQINATNLVELNDTAVFRCNVGAGTNLAYHWLNGSSEVTANLVQLELEDAILKIPKVTRYDQGPFRCNVSNGISDGISRSVPLNISYGPSDVNLTAHPSRAHMDAYKSGTDITLSCSAQSEPDATYEWIFEGQSLNQYGPQLQLPNTKQNQTGNYTCLAHNSVTLRFASVTAMIRIVDPISAVSIKHIGKPPILDESFTLGCYITGPVDHICWMKNGNQISADNRTSFSEDNTNAGDNTNMTITPVQHSDNGNYTCEAFNAVSNMTSTPYRVVVNYGPETPMIMGKTIALTGSNVTLTCSASSQPPSNFSWYFNGFLVANGSVYDIGPLTLDNHGYYKCVAFNDITDRNSTTSMMLTVIEPVTMATVKVLGVQPIVNHVFNLTCEATGSVYSIHWMKNGGYLYPDNRTALSMDNKTFTFNPVLHSDNGQYQCVASNPLTSKTSDNYTLLVNYGPETPVIMGKTIALTGSNVNLTCSASSQPPSVFSWYFNGFLVANGSVYEIGPLTLDNHGYYKCVAFNSITDRNSTTSTMLTVFEPVTMATVKVLGVQPIANHMFNLTCEATGSVYSIHWMKNGGYLYTDNRTTLSGDNKTFTFNPVLHSDNGQYQCVASNPLTSKTSDNYTLLVNYGPEKPVISGPAVVETGSNVTLTCSASSQPPSNFSWYFNGAVVANGSVYEIGPLTLDEHGYYTCVAFNEITEKKINASKMLTVVPPITHVHIQTSPKQAIEGESFALTCNVTGPEDHIYWWENGQVLTANNIVFSMNNRTVTIDPVQHSDKGDYKCQAFNAVSNKTSVAFSLVVNYGPEKPVIMGPEMAITGQNVTLTCSASSEPPSVFSWYFNGSLVANGSVYEIDPLTLDNHGYYKCVAFNSITGWSNNTSKMLTVIAPIASASISVGSPAILDKSFNMTCTVDGKPDSIHWMKNGSYLYPNERTVFSQGNMTVTFNSVEHSDQGNYTCQATNIANSITSLEFTLTVNYGPEKPVISGPAVAEIGQNVTLTCSASSEPTSIFSWYFNGSQVANGSVYETGPLTLDKQGNYKCKAFNSITGWSSESSKMLTVIEAIQYVMVKNNTTPISSDELTLTCDIGGPYMSLYWLKNDVSLSNMSDGMSLYNNSLHFDSVEVSDDGKYQCVAKNLAGDHTSPPYELLVNYGPLDVQLTGPDKVVLVTHFAYVFLDCSAKSRPTSTYQWFFQHKVGVDAMWLGNGPTLKVVVSTEHTGNYTCKATNHVTAITMNDTRSYTFSAGTSTLPVQSRGGLMLMLLVTLSLCVFNN